MKKIRCKFRLEVLKNESGLTSLFPLDCKENKSFTNIKEHSPDGSIRILVDEGTKAAEFFVLGKEYYIDIIDPDSVFRPKPPKPQKTEAKNKRFKFLTQISGVISHPVIDAPNEAAARKDFEKLYKGAPIHDVKEIG